MAKSANKIRASILMYYAKAQKLLDAHKLKCPICVANANAQKAALDKGEDPTKVELFPCADAKNLFETMEWMLSQARPQPSGFHSQVKSAKKIKASILKYSAKVQKLLDAHKRECPICVANDNAQKAALDKGKDPTKVELIPCRVAETLVEEKKKKPWW